MLVLPKPTSKEFEEMTTTCHDSVREVFKHYIADNDILSYSTDTTIVFLTKAEIADLWNKFTSNNKVINGLESTAWEDDYQETFSYFVVNETKLDESARFFSHMMDEAYGVYMNQGWRLPSISELSAMCNKETGETVKGFPYSYYYWSSTSSSNGNGSAWIACFYSGVQSYYSKDYNNKYNNYYVRCVRNIPNGLELSPVSDKAMTWQEVINYAKTLQVDPKDITTVELKGWCYEEVIPEKTYVVRVEVNVKECDLGEIEVKANSREEAIEKAIQVYEDGDLSEVDFWASDMREESLWTETKDSWEVTVKEEN